MIPNSPSPQALLSRIRWGFACLIVAHSLCLMGLRASSAATDGIKIDRLFGPEIPTGRYKHPACFDVLRNGDLYLVYYGGDGDFLLPVYLETGKNTEFTAATTCSFFLRFNPKTKTWKESNRIHSRLGNLQPSAVQLDDQKPFAKP